MLSYHGDSFFPLSSEHTFSLLFHLSDCRTFHQASFSRGRWCKSSRCPLLSAQTSCRGHAPFRRPLKKKKTTTNRSQSETHLRPASQLSVAREEINNNSWRWARTDSDTLVRVGFSLEELFFFSVCFLIIFFFRFLPPTSAWMAVSLCCLALVAVFLFVVCELWNDSLCCCSTAQMFPVLGRSGEGWEREGSKSYFCFCNCRLTWFLTWQWFSCLYWLIVETLSDWIFFSPLIIILCFSVVVFLLRDFVWCYIAGRLSPNCCHFSCQESHTIASCYFSYVWL